MTILQLPDTLQLQSEDDNYQRVTVVTTVMERYIKETVTKREVIGSQGQVLESKETVVVSTVFDIVLSSARAKGIKSTLFLFVYFPTAPFHLKRATFIAANQLANIKIVST